MAGCAQLKVPAIDPSGRRIFLPCEQGTTFVPPTPVPCAPQPAFTTPPVPPPCGPDAAPPLVTPPPAGPVAVMPAPAPARTPATACGSGQARQGYLTLSPARLLAPVGSEIVLVAGLCDDRGALVARQPLEWSLSQESVGQIVSSGEEQDCFRFIRSSPEERHTGSYAVTRTLNSDRVMTRGTPQASDDVPLQRGQSWISVTSPTEGITHVSVVAPEAVNWDQRRQTATIYWVDVQWTLPPQAIMQAGQPHMLTTTVTRRSSGKPLADWIVRYEVAGQSGLAFAPNNQPTVDVTTDGNGRASINLVPVHKATTAQVLVQIVRPSKCDDEFPPLVVGQGYTSATWSAPDPKVTVTGPQTAALGSTVTYRADVSNAGDVTARQIVASTKIPPNMTFLQSNPPARVLGDLLTWDLGDLPPGTVKPIQISVRPERNADVRFCVRVESADQLQGQRLTAEACIPTRVFSSNLAVKLNGPATAQVGERVTYEIEVTNTGSEALNNVVLRDRLPAGLEHPSERGSLIERTLDQPLLPSLSRRIAVELLVRQTGRLCHTVDAVAAGGHVASANACLDVTAPAPPPRPEPKPAVNVTLSGPDRARVGEAVDYSMQIVNTGNVPLTQVQIVGTYEPSLYPQEATPGYDTASLRQRGEFVWSVARLEPGNQVTLGVKLQCLRAASAAWCRVFVQAAENIRATQEKPLVILSAEPPPAIPSPGPERERPAEPERVTGELRVDIADQQDPVPVNGIITYIISIENARNVSDKKVALTILLPPGLEYVKLNGPSVVRASSPDGRTIEVAEIAELRAGETLKPFYLQARGLRIGKHTVKVKADSFRSAQPVEAQADTTVNLAG